MLAKDALAGDANRIYPMMLCVRYRFPKVNEGN